MIGLLLIYFIGKAFYELAHEHDRSQWGFAILGVVSYYGGTFIGGFILGLIYEFGLSESIENVNSVLLGFMAVPFGLLICWGFYHLLKKSWSRSADSNSASSEVLDADLLNDKEQQ